MKNADINFLCRSCTQELQNKLKIIKDTRPDFLKNLIFLEIKDKSLVELKEEYDIKIVLYLWCANRHFGLFVRSTLFDKRGGYKDIVLENVVNNGQSLVMPPESHPLNGDHLKENRIMSVDSQNNLTTPDLNEANINFMKNMDHKINQLGMMHLHNMKHMSKMRRNFLIVLLVLIVLAAAGLAGGLGFYFTISKEVATAVNQQNFNRVDLSEDVKNLELGQINDNQAATILTAVKIKNSKLIAPDILLKKITATTALLTPKYSSTRYNYSSSVMVEFSAERLTLQTHLQKQVIKNIPTYDEPSILQELEIENPNLMVSELAISLNSALSQQADVLVKPDSKVYLIPDKITVYFSNSGQKLITEDLSEPNLGDIKARSTSSILLALQTKNPKLSLQEIMLVPGSIMLDQAELAVKENSKFYFASDNVKIYYRINNPHVGTLKKWFEQEWFVGDNYYISDIIQLKNGVVWEVYNHMLFRAGMDGNIIGLVNKNLNSNKFSWSNLLLLSTNLVLAYNSIDHKMYFLTPDGQIDSVISEEILKNKDEAIEGMMELQNGNIFISTNSKHFYILNAEGLVIQQIAVPSSLNIDIVKAILKLSDNNYLFFDRNKQVYSFNSTSLEIKVIQKSINEWILSAIQTQDGILLGGGYDGQIYQFNADGSVRQIVADLKAKINDSNIIRVMLIEKLCLLSNNEIIIGSNKVIAFLNNN